MAKKDLTHFVRFGSLDLKTQKGYTPNTNTISFMHLNNADVVQRHNSWVKTSMKTWQKAFRL